MSTIREERKRGAKGPTANTNERYRAALELYHTTDLSLKAICEQTRTPLSAFKMYIYRWHRESLLARHGISSTTQEAATTKLRKKRGQTRAAHEKYKDAIRACDDMAYVQYNVSQIARIFHLSPTALGNQLRNHYPEILERREKERRRQGINDNIPRGARACSKEQYAEAVEHLRTTDDSVKRTAELFTLSYPGLREHLLYYHKDLLHKRAEKRKHAKATKVLGALTGNGRHHEPTANSVEKYREAVRLYRTTAMTQQEIAKVTGVNKCHLSDYLRRWHYELVLAHRGIKNGKKDVDLSTTKHYLKSTAEKYAAAIERLKSSGLTTAEVAKEFNLHPETFRAYLHEHEPSLAASLGMTHLPNGKLVSARSMEKYAEAVRLFETTTEPLKSIALRLGIQYNSIGGFVRRSRPDAIEIHNRLVELEKRLRQEKAQAVSAHYARKKEEKEKEHILQALKQTGHNKKETAELLGISRSTLYSKLRALGIADEAGVRPQTRRG